MVSSHDNVSMALFCDFENVALGVRDAKYEKFDIRPILERLLLKGSIVIKKAYCDWDRYKGFKASMHEANFELIEIPHVRQSGKNSADIRLVVDALDLCYTKSHVNTFVIISGDSDFSPLVSKLRENAKQVIGVGVKQSTSDLLIANCDEFIFYDDLVRESQRAAAKRETRETHAAPRRSPDEERRRKEELDARKSKAIEMAVETFDALVSERGDSGKMWASVLKEAIKRRKPDFNESYYGFRAFGNLLEEAQARGLLEFGRDEKSGTYVYRTNAGPSRAEPSNDPQMAFEAPVEQAAAEEAGGRREPRRNGRGRGKPQIELPGLPEAPVEQAAAEDAGARHEPRRRGRGGRGKPVADSAPLPDIQAETTASDESGYRHETSADEPYGGTYDEDRGEDRDQDRGERGRDPSLTDAATAFGAPAEQAAADEPGSRREPRRRGRGGRGKSVADPFMAFEKPVESAAMEETGGAHDKSRDEVFDDIFNDDRGEGRNERRRAASLADAAAVFEAPAEQAPAEEAESRQEPRRRSRGGRGKAAEKNAAETPQQLRPETSVEPAAAQDAAPAPVQAAPEDAPAKPARKSATRARRPRKTAAASDDA